MSAETAKKWLGSPAAAPSFLAFCALIVAYGPGFLHAVLDDAPDWISTAALEAQQAALEAEHDRIARQLAALRGQI